MILSTEQQAHVRIMRCVLDAVHDTPLVLKGGTSLMLCHGLDRFSEDLDFDAPKKLNLESRIGLGLRAIASDIHITRTKDTETAQRYRIEYVATSIEGRLKVEVSCRDEIDESDVIELERIRTYRVARLFHQKLNALEGRTTARDLYDVHHLVNRHRAGLHADDIIRLRGGVNDINRLEARFRPAFEEDDLFRNGTEIVARLLLEIQSALE